MQQQSDRTVYVGNVGKEVDEAALMALFGHCGTVTQIRVAGDPTYDTRYSFIEFTTPEEAGTALLLDGMNVFERQIRVSMARGGSGPGVVRSNDPDRVQRTIHVGGLPFEEISEETLAEYFAHVGEVHAVRKSGRFAWIEFATLQSAQQALALDGESMGTGTMKVSASKTPIHTAGWRAQLLYLECWHLSSALNLAQKFRDPPPTKPMQSPPPPRMAMPPGAPPFGAPPFARPPPGPPPYGAPQGGFGGFHAPPSGFPPQFGAPPHGPPPGGMYGAGGPFQPGPPPQGPPGGFAGGPPPAYY